MLVAKGCDDSEKKVETASIHAVRSLKNAIPFFVFLLQAKLHVDSYQVWSCIVEEGKPSCFSGFDVHVFGMICTIVLYMYLCT